MATLAEFSYQGLGNLDNYSNEFRQMSVLQGYKIGMYMNDLCHLLLNHEVKPKNAKRDRRKYQIPDGLPALIKTLIRMFEVDLVETNRKRYADRFIDWVWRQTSYAEIYKVRSDKALDPNGLKRALKVLENKGVINRARTWVKKEKKTLLRIKLNPGRLLDLIQESRIKPKEIIIKVRAKAGKKSAERLVIKDRIINNKAIAESPTAPVVVAIDSSSTKKEAVLASPDREPIYFEKQEAALLLSAGPEVNRIWKAMEHRDIVKFDFLNARKRLMSLKALIRRVEHPQEQHRLTESDWDRYEQHVCANIAYGEWYCDLSVEFFLSTWSTIKRILLAAKHQEQGIEARCSLDLLKNIERDTQSETKDITKRFLSVFEYRRSKSPGLDLVRCLLEHFSDDIYSLLRVAHRLKVDLTEYMGNLRKSFRQWCFRCPDYFLALWHKKLFPVGDWARFNHYEMEQLTASADVVKFKALVRYNTSLDLDCRECPFPALA